MSAITKAITGIDFELLRKQKLAMLELRHTLHMAFSVTEKPIASLDGIVELIDSIQDAVVEDRILTEEEVFGKPKCEHNIVSAKNEVVKSGYICTECGGLFTTADGKEVNDEGNVSK